MAETLARATCSPIRRRSSASCAEFPRATPTSLAALVAGGREPSARAERPPRHFRELFHVLNAIVRDQARAAMTTPVHDRVRIGLVATSDRASQGVYRDEGIPALEQWLAGALLNPLELERRLIPDERR